MNIVNKIKDNPYLFSILLIAFISRFAGIFHDLPYSYFPDEEHFVNRAVSFGSGDMNPHWFHKPAFLMYLLFFEYGLYFVIGKIFGLFTSAQDFAISFFQSKGPFLFMGRLTVTLFGIATVFITYLIGKDYFNRRTGLIAALFLSLAMGHISSSQVVKADVPTTFFTMLSFYFTYKIYTSGRFKYYILAGVFAGLGMATKYYSVILVPTIFFAHLLYLRKANLSVVKNIINKSSVTVVIGFLFTFFVASPYNFLDPLGFKGTFVRPFSKLLDIGGKSTEAFLQATGVEVQNFVFLKSVGHYISVLAGPEGMGVIGIVALIGLIVLLIRLSPQNLILLSFPVIFIIIANKVNPFYSEVRHLNPIYPFMTLFAAYFINFLSERFQSKIRMEWLVIAIVILILIMPVYRIIKHDYLINRPDTRTVAKEWIEANIPSGTKILLDENTVRLSPDKKFYEEMLERAKNHEKSQFTAHAETFSRYSLKALPEITYGITFIRFPWWQAQEKQPNLYYATSEHDKDMGNPLRPVGVMPYKYYVDSKYEYIVVSREIYGRFLKDDSKIARAFPSFSRFYNTLFNKGELIKEFQSDSPKSRGPTIKIFKVE